MAKTVAKLFMASVMGIFELLICENCKKLLFGAGKAQGINPIERPKFCPQCGQEIDFQWKDLSEKEIMAYTET